MADIRRNIDWYEARFRAIGDKKEVEKWIRNRLKVSNRRDYEKFVATAAKKRVFSAKEEEKAEDGEN